MALRSLDLPYIVFFICGLAAGIATLAASLILKTSINGLFVPEIASQALVSLTSGEIESRAVETLGPLAKYSTFFGATFINILLYGFIGLFLGILFNKLHVKQFIKKAIISSFLSYMIILIIYFTFITINTLPGQKLLIPSLSLTILLIPHLIFGFIFSFCFERIRKKNTSLLYEEKDIKSKYDNKMKKEYPEETSTSTESQIDYKKRALIRSLAVSAIALPLIYFGFNRLFSQSEQQQQQQQQQQQLAVSPANLKYVPKSRPPGFEDATLTPLIDAEVTPTYLFYRIDKNAIVPAIDSSSWSLSIKGLVNNPLTLNYEQIKSMGSVEEYATLSCISNKIGGDLVSSALWKGVRLRDILNKANVKQQVKYIVFRCYDGYDVGIPLESGLMDGTILAYNMNNIPLPNDHGFPLRAIVPGFYGMMNPKWITEIELVDSTYEGFWQRKGWTNNPNNNIYSTIVTVGNQEITNRFPNLVNNNFVINKSNQIAGIAFAGDRGISKIEVSTDGGNTWKTAIVKDPLSKYTWVLWSSTFIPKAGGDYNIVVRATDKNGKVQSVDFADPFPNGASGYDMVSVRV
jgi:DMSO/TMAO reductase YedYZ molybdopterin-dependent catalytic subunit